MSQCAYVACVLFADTNIYLQGIQTRHDSLHYDYNYNDHCFFPGGLPSILQHLQMLVIPNSECQNRMNSISGAEIASFHICIYNDQQDHSSCNVCIIIFCRSLFVLTSFFFWPLYCLFLCDLRLRSTTLVTFLVSFWICIEHRSYQHCLTSSYLLFQWVRKRGKNKWATK